MSGDILVMKGGGSSKRNIVVTRELRTWLLVISHLEKFHRNMKRFLTEDNSLLTDLLIYFVLWHTI